MNTPCERRSEPASGVDFDAVPTFIVADLSSSSMMNSLFDLGIEDIISHETSFEFLVSKVRKVQTRLESKRENKEQLSREDSGARGRLSDMSLIDLLQALGPGQKTAKVTVTPTSDETGLVVYLDQGLIVYAAIGDTVGPEAIYTAIGWNEGTWTVSSVAEGELPEPNNHLTNESLLMEGCRRLDEKEHSEHTVREKV